MPDAHPDRERFDLEIRAWIYEFFASTGTAPSPVDIGSSFDIPLDQAEASLRRLAEVNDALVLLPGSPYIWMAEPFSAVPTSFLVQSGERRWWGNCIWDALGILSALDVDGDVKTTCPDCRDPLVVSVRDRKVVESEGIAHFAVPAQDWWRDIGYT
jgi:hypothetical protein